MTPLRVDRFLALDVGTSGVKAVLTDGEGSLLDSAYRSYPLNALPDDGVEQDLDQIFAACLEASSELFSRSSSREVAGIALTAQMFNIVAVDEAGVPLAPMISWLDQRCEPAAAALAARVSHEEQFELVSSVVTGKDMVPRILWLREHRPEVYAASRWLLDCKEALVMRLTGAAVTDHAGASAYRLYDPATKDWHRTACERFGVDAAKLPAVRNASDLAGVLRDEVADHLGLPPGVPVYVGAGDVPASQLGSGAVRPGEAHLSLGTAAYFGLLLDRPLTDPAGQLGVLSHADPDLSILWLEIATGGAALAWVLRLLGLSVDGKVDYGHVERLVREAEPSMGALLCGPWLSGERVPVFDDNARASFSGLGLHHGPGHLIRAVMEGVAYQMRWALEYGVDYGQKVSKIRVVGGGALGSEWTQIITDILGHQLECVADAQDAAAVGAAACAIVGSGAQSSFDFLADRVGIARTYTPNADLAEEYDGRYARFQGLFRALEPLSI